MEKIIVIGGAPGDCASSETRALTLSLPLPYSDHIERDSAWVSKAAELYRIKQSLKQLEAAEKALVEELKKLSDESNSRGGGFVFSCIERLGTVQYKNIPALKGINLDEFRTPPINTWKLIKE